MYFSQAVNPAPGLDPGRRRRLEGGPAAAAARAIRLAARLACDPVRRIGTLLHRRHVYAQMLKMPDYLLEDMGLTREQIAAAKKRPLL